MKYRSALFLLLPLMACAHGRHKQKARQRPPIPIAAECNTGCVFYPRYSKEQLRSFFPFNVAKSAVVLAFEPPFYADTVRVTTDTFGYTQVHELLPLSNTMMDSLASLMRNVLPANHYLKHKNCKTFEGSAACYNPRHAIIFLDKANKEIAKLEVCFECRKSFMLPGDQFKNEITCTGWLDLLHQFIAACGIQYGL